MTTQNKGISQNEIVGKVATQFHTFLDTFKRPQNLIKVSNVENELEALETLANGFKRDIVEEKTYWWAYREHNTAYSEWEKVENILGWYLNEANRYIMEIDWSQYR